LPTAEALSRIRITIFSPDFEPEVATRKSIFAGFRAWRRTSRPGASASSEISIAARTLKTFRTASAGRPVEPARRRGGCVDPVADRELLGGRLEVDVGRPTEHGVVDEFLGGHVRLRLLGLRHAIRVGLGRPLGLATKTIGGPALSSSSPLLKTPCIPILFIKLLATSPR